MLDIIPGLPSRYLFYLRSQRWSRERLDAYNDKMLRRVIQHAGRRVPYYRDLFREINLDPDRFRGREDLRRIPLLDKETLRTRQDEFRADDAEKYGVEWESTSGSTGTPLHLIVDRGARSNKLAALIRSYQWAGYRLGMRTFSLQSYYIEDADFEYKRLFNVLRFDSNKLKRESALKVIKKINDIKPKFFMGFPFDLLMLSQFAAEEGLSIHPPDAIVTYGETLSKRKRELLESAYKCEVFDYYSHHECVAMIAECEHHTRHLIEDFAYHEIVDENGDDAFEQGTGELVGTGFYNYAMPIIRYRTGDSVVLSHDDSLCECGRSFRVVREIVGKQCDYIETPDGRLLGAVMSHSIDHAGGVVMSQCVQDTLDHIYINLVVDGTYDNDSEKALEAGLRKRLGNEIKLDFKVVPQLEKNRGGKTPFIMSKIGHEYI